MNHHQYIKSVRKIIIMSLIAWFVHAYEELFGNLERVLYYVVDVFLSFLCNNFSLDLMQAIVLCLALFLFPLLTATYLLLGDDKTAPFGGLILGSLIMVEIHHVIESIVDVSYNPGAFSGFFLGCFGLYLVTISIRQACAYSEVRNLC